jgi:hypothetical protein
LLLTFLRKPDCNNYYNIAVIQEQQYVNSFENFIEDMSKVQTLIYHLPNGKMLTIEMENMDIFLDMDLEIGRVCDTSAIDGVVHFFPQGNA